MNRRFFHLPKNVTPRTRNAIRYAGIITLATIFALPLELYLSFRAGAWQLWAATGVILGVFALSLISRWLIQTGKIERGVQVLIYGILIGVIANPFLIADLGIVLGITAVMLTVLIASQIVERPEHFIVTSFVAGAVTILLDLFLPPYRLIVPELQIFAPIITYTVVVILSFMTLRRFQDFSLRTKLLIVFLLVTLIPLGIVSFLNARTTRQDLINNPNNYLQSAAAETAHTLDKFIADNLTNVQVAAQSHIWGEFLALSPADRPGSESEQALYIDLRAQAQRNEYITSVGVYDKSGLIVADTDPAEVGENESDRLIFAEVLRTNLPYVSPVIFDNGNLLLYFGAPLHDDAGKIIGVFRVRYDAAVLQEILVQKAAIAGLEDSAIDLFDENHIFLATSAAPEDILRTVSVLPAEKFAQLQVEGRLPEGSSAESLSLNQVDLAEILGKVSQQSIFTLESENEQVAVMRLENQPWIVMFAQNQEVYLAPLAAQRRNITVIGLIVAGFAALVAVLVSQTISRPLVNLTSIAERISTGDMTAQARVESEDEIGKLAHTFNTMTGQLQQTLKRLDRRATQIATSAEVSRRLSTILNERQLIIEVVEQIKAAFDFYHVHIYLLDEPSGDLIMAGGTGDAGAAMLGSGHKIPKGKGLVGRAAETNNPVLVPDTSKDPNWLPNPLLPETNSEAAVPIATTNKMLGVLDVQHNETDGLKQEDIDLLQSLANQIAVALLNARSYTEAQQRADREARIASIGRKIQSTTSVEGALQTVVRELGRTLGAHDIQIILEAPRLAEDSRKPD